MSVKISKSESAFQIGNVLLMALLIVVTLYPMIYVVFASLSDPQTFATQDGLMFRPAGFSLDAYRTVLEMQSIRLGFRNTTFYLFVGTLISMTLSIFAAYAASRKDFLFRKPFMIFILITMFFGGGMIPTYLVVEGLGLTNSIWAVLIPGALSTYNIIVLRAGFESIPESLIESASIDGANDFTVLFRIILPLSTATLATITLFYAVGRWSEWYSALVYLQARRDLYPLQMILREMLVQGDMTDPAVVSALGQEGSTRYLLNQIIKYAAIVVTTVPILLVYPFLQRYFVKGVMIGAVKE